MVKLKSILTGALLILLSLSCIGCEGRLPHPSDYRASPFRLELSAVREGVTISAEGSYSPAKSQDLPWDFSLRLTAPPSLEGLVLSRRDGVLSLSFEGLEVKNDTLGGLLSLFSLPVSEGELQGIAREGDLLYAQIAWEGDAPPTELWLDSKSGVPKRIKRGALSMEILFFASVSSDT